MPPGVSVYNSVLVLLLTTSSWAPLCSAAPWTGLLSRRFSLVLDYSPAPSPEDGPPASAGALRDPKYLPAQIGGIVGAYAFSLVLVALLLLALSKTRRDHLRNRDRPPEEDGIFFEEFNPFPDPFLLQTEEDYKRQLEEFQRLEELEQLEQFQHQQQLQPQQFQNSQFHLPQFQPVDQPYHQQYHHPQFPQPSLEHHQLQTLSLQIPTSPIRNFSLPSPSPLSPTRTGPLSPTKSQRSIFTAPSPTSTILAPGIDLSVDQTVVGRDRAMAQQQLEEMYKYVMEQEQAKAEGREYQGPMLTAPSSNTVNPTPAKAGKKERNKPSNLNLAQDEKAQSRSSSIFSFLKSPRKNKMGAPGMTISSPILTPMSGTFPRHDDQEMNAIMPRHYAPPAPPPVQSDLPFRRAAASAAGSSHLPTPDISPVSTQSIDSRIDAAVGLPPTRAARREQREREAGGHDRAPYHARDISSAATSTAGDHEPISASSEKSTSKLVSLPVSPRPGATRFPSDISLPASPRPQQQSFQLPGHHNANSSTSSFPRPSGAGSAAASAVREGGALPLRAYEASVASPTAPSYATTKQTVFTRAPMSPGLPTGMRTPWTGAPVPYTPYQPFSPVVPITPSVVTKADRKRMRKMEPKTPTVEMVRSEEDIW